MSEKQYNVQDLIWGHFKVAPIDDPRAAMKKIAEILLDTVPAADKSSFGQLLQWIEERPNEPTTET